MGKFSVWGLLVFVQYFFLQIKGTFIILEEGTSPPLYIKAVSKVQPGSSELRCTVFITLLSST